MCFWGLWSILCAGFSGFKRRTYLAASFGLQKMCAAYVICFLLSVNCIGHLRLNIFWLLMGKFMLRLPCANYVIMCSLKRFFFGIRYYFSQLFIVHGWLVTPLHQVVSKGSLSIWPTANPFYRGIFFEIILISSLFL